jgi:hypothetical protein
MTMSYNLDPMQLSNDERVAAIVAAEREIARLQARQLRLVAALSDDPYAESPVPELDRDWMREELRAALGESAVRVTERVELARTMVHRLPTTLRALESGVLTLRHARHLVQAVTPLPHAAVVAVETAALAFAESHDLTGFERKVRREVLKLDSRTPEQQLADALGQRRVWVAPQTDGMAVVGAVLPADGAQAVRAAIDVVASCRQPGDERTADQRRADALVQLAVDALNGYRDCPRCSRDVEQNTSADVVRNDKAERPTRRPAPARRELRPAVQVTVALSTLLGLDEQAGELDGHGPIPAALARRIAADPSGTWRRLLTDSTGTLLDYGRAVYRPPAGLRLFVQARDRECMFPTCHRRASRCELDHVTPWKDGGPTDARNLFALCTRHHHAKHEGGWRVRRLDDGSARWTSPLGRVYTVAITTYPVDTTFDSVVPDDNNQQRGDRADRAA